MMRGCKDGRFDRRLRGNCRCDASSACAEWKLDQEGPASQTLDHIFIELAHG